MEKKTYEKTIGKLREIIEKDERFRSNVYLVGGCVRDLLLGLTPKDIDLCIDYPRGNIEFIEYLKSNYPRETVSGFTVYERYGTSRFTLHLGSDEDVEIECVIPRSESYKLGPRKPDQVMQVSLENDAYRRDFCCNALYKNLETGKLLDPTGRGIEDVGNKILRTPLEPKQTFIDDPLRMLRAIRFYCTKGFDIDKDVLENIRDYEEYSSVSPERVQDELGKILMSPRAVEGIRLMIDTKLIYPYIPELVDYKDFDQRSKYHSLSWLEHTLSVLRILVEHNPGASLELRLSALLHDISKPKIWKEKSDGSYSYHDHETTSSIRAREILRKLKYSRDTIKKVCFLIEKHMILKQHYSYKTREYTGTKKVTRKILKDTGENLGDLLKLIDADNLSHAPEWNMPGQVSSFLEAISILGDMEEKQVESGYKVPVSGDDIIQWFNIKPGKLVKEIKDTMQELYEENSEMSGEEIKDKFLSLYNGRDKFLWFAKVPGNHFWVFLKKPVKKNGYWWSDDGDLPEEFDEKDILWDEITKNELSHQSAIYFPKIYMKYLRRKRVREIAKGIEKCMRELDDINGFSEINLEYSGNDLSIKLDFSDGDQISIL